MSNDYVGKLCEWVATRPATLQEKNLVAFLAVRDDVRDALAAGYTVKTIWAHLYESKRIAVKYDAFLGYVHRLLPQPDFRQSAAARANGVPSGAAIKPTLPARPGKPGDKPRGFVFNPIPNKDELL